MKENDLAVCGTWAEGIDNLGNKIKEMGAKQTNDLPPLFIHQKEYNCPIRKKI